MKIAYSADEPSLSTGFLEIVLAQGRCCMRTSADGRPYHRLETRCFYCGPRVTSAPSVSIGDCHGQQQRCFLRSQCLLYFYPSLSHTYLILLLSIDSTQSTTVVQSVAKVNCISKCTSRSFTQAQTLFGPQVATLETQAVHLTVRAIPCSSLHSRDDHILAKVLLSSFSPKITTGDQF